MGEPEMREARSQRRAKQAKESTKRSPKGGEAAHSRSPMKPCNFFFFSLVSCGRCSLAHLPLPFLHPMRCIARSHPQRGPILSSQ